MADHRTKREKTGLNMFASRALRQILSTLSITVTLFGSVAHAAAIPALDPTELDFGEQSVGTSSEEKLIKLTNGGDTDYLITLIAVTGNEFWISHDCANSTDPTYIGTLTPGNSCTVRASFIPTRLEGTENNLIIAGNVQPVLAVKLKGTGINGLSFLPPRLDFGAIAQNRKAMLTTRVRNTTDISVRITKIATADNNFTLVANTCTKRSSRLKPGASCKLTYRYRPLTSQAHSTATSFNFDDTTFPTGELLLTGTVGTPTPPTIQSVSPFSPSIAGLGNRIILHGDSGFTVKPGKVLLKTKPANSGDPVITKRAKIVAWTDRIAIFDVPEVSAGDYFVSVIRRDGQSATTENLPTPSGNPDLPNSYFLTVKIPRIDKLEPSEGVPKSVVTISGDYFGTVKPKVFFVPIGDLTASRIKARVLKGNNSTSVKVRVPKGLSPGNYQVVVKNAAGESETGDVTTFAVPQL